MIDLYTAATPNGQKITIALEEMKLPYDLIKINFNENQKKHPVS